MAPKDEDKTTFVTKCGLYYYRVMLFGLKNVDITYQCLVNKIFKDQIDQNMVVYVDDMLVKSHTLGNHVDDVEETFATLCRYQMMLIPAKCTFRVTLGNFLGFIVSHRGIEANSEKIQIVRQMDALKIVKEVQRLTGWVASLSRFISYRLSGAYPLKH